MPSCNAVTSFSSTGTLLPAESKPNASAIKCKKAWSVLELERISNSHYSVVCDHNYCLRDGDGENWRVFFFVRQETRHKFGPHLSRFIFNSFANTEVTTHTGAGVVGESFQ